MGIEYGRNAFTQKVGNPIQLTYDGKPTWKSGSVTIDWGTVAAVGSDTVLANEGVTIPSGTKFLKVGQLLARITNAGAFTVTVTGTPTGGSFTLAIYNPLTYGTSTITVPYNASVSAVQALIDAAVGAGLFVVSGAGALPGNAHTVTATGAMLGQPLTAPTAASSLTGGSSPAVATAVTVGGGSFGKFGPYDPGASDGRQTLARSACGLLNETIQENGPVGMPTQQTTNHPGLIVGGRVWRDRLVANNSANSLANGPTFATLEAALPLLQYALNP